ncbi:hypothetical protein BDV28DRAFT_139828 [Aspergillus coremiiformis]|uniref:Uncharacterized protein n=1 Tax=Aspergillus coremiiformis TaxID=138285 RepID=A0A5N6YXC8_9EURO|nr:hypothetical protein BDV28DRAFT_139828 [Aspergillus coremiiformis]
MEIVTTIPQSAKRDPLPSYSWSRSGEVIRSTPYIDRSSLGAYYITYIKYSVYELTKSTGNWR